VSSLTRDQKIELLTAIVDGKQLQDGFIPLGSPIRWTDSRDIQMTITLILRGAPVRIKPADPRVCFVHWNDDGSVEVRSSSDLVPEDWQRVVEDISKPS
jgi:hypothetical protein